MRKNKKKSVDELINDLKFTDNFTRLASWKIDVILKIINFLTRINNFPKVIKNVVKSINDIDKAQTFK